MNTRNTRLGRREFLQTTIAGLATVTVSALSRAVAQGSTANSRLRLGLIGCGARGLMLLEMFKEHGGYEIAAVADYFEDRVKEAAEQAGLAPSRTFTGLACAEKMIAQGGLDAVAVISPSYFHPTQTRAAVDAGLHVYLAKPVAVDVPGCRSISESNEIARHKGLVILVDFQTRVNEFFIEAVRRVHAGALGDFCFGESIYHCEWFPIKEWADPVEARLRNWNFDQALSGDVIVEQNIHVLDVTSWLMKETPPLRCTGTGGRRVRTHVGDAWDHYALVYEYANNVGVTFSSRQFPGYGELGGILNRMFGSKGIYSSQYSGNVMIRGGEGSFYRGGKTSTIYRDGAIANIKAFHEAIMRKDVGNPTVPCSVTSNLIAIMGRMAAREKRTVTWDEVVNARQKLETDLTGLKI
jgi:predicted dehydrogenase